MISDDEAEDSDSHENDLVIVDHPLEGEDLV